MHICYVITRAEMGGSQTHVLSLLRGFRDRFQLTLATGEEGFLTEEARKLGICTYVLPNLVQPLRPAQDFTALKEVVTLLRNIKPDLVHCHTSKAGVIGRVAARIAGVPVVYTAHTWSFADGTSRLWKLVGRPSERLAAKWTGKIIAVSDSNRALAVEQRVVPTGKVVTVHNGICDTWLRARPNERDVPRIVMVARFAPQKNQMQLVETAASLEIPFLLTFVGDGPTRPAVEAAAYQAGLGDRVEFLGIRKDTDRILADSSIFALATNWEGFPITILEAMRAGLPVVATDVDGVREAVIDGETGFLVSRNDSAALRERLTFLLTNSEARASMGRYGRQRYEAEFTVSAMLRKVESVYLDSLPERAKSQAALQSA
ncbi:MAG: glycosyltransferase family 4 protein [Bryobacteraceae bacterium]